MTTLVIAEHDNATLHPARLNAVGAATKLGGMRASLYNALPLAGVQALVDYMKIFDQRHG